MIDVSVKVQVTVAGHICVDLVPEVSAETRIEPDTLLAVGPLTVTPGGCVANTGGALADLGLPVTISAGIGDDQLGALIPIMLADRGLDPRGLVVEPGLATSYSIVIEPPRENRSLWHHVGANSAFDGSRVDLDNTDLLHLGYPPLLPALARHHGRALVALFERARSRQITTSLDMAVVDPNSEAGRVDWRAFLEAVLPLTDVFSPSVDDLASALRLEPDDTDPAQLARDLVGLGAGIVLITAGGGGVFLCAADADRLKRAGRVVRPVAAAWAGAETWLPAEPVERVATTNGAGDAASAGLLHALAGRLHPEPALRHVTRVAAARVYGSPLRASRFGNDSHPSP